MHKSMTPGIERCNIRDSTHTIIYVTDFLLFKNKLAIKGEKGNGTLQERQCIKSMTL